MIQMVSILRMKDAILAAGIGCVRSVDPQLGIKTASLKNRCAIPDPITTVAGSRGFPKGTFI